MMKYCIVVAIVYMKRPQFFNAQPIKPIHHLPNLHQIAGIENRSYSYSGPIEELLIEHARDEGSDNNDMLEINNHEARHSRKTDDVLNTRRKRLTNTTDGNDGIRPISFDPVVPEEPIPKAPPVDHGSTQVGLSCVNKDGGCLNDSDGRPVSFDVVQPQQPLPVPPPVEHGSSQAGLEEHGGSQGKVSSPGVSTTEVSSTTKQATKDQKTEPGRGHVIRPGCAPILVLFNILLLFYYTANII